MSATAIIRRKSSKVREKHPAPTCAAGTVGPIHWPPRPAVQGDQKSFRWPNWEVRRVAAALDSCPMGSSVAFRIDGQPRFGITKSAPWCQDGRLWVLVAGFDVAFRFEHVRVVKQLPPLSLD